MPKSSNNRVPPPMHNLNFFDKIIISVLLLWSGLNNWWAIKITKGVARLRMKSRKIGKLLVILVGNVAITNIDI